MSLCGFKAIFLLQWAVGLHQQWRRMLVVLKTDVSAQLGNAGPEYV